MRRSGLWILLAALVAGGCSVSTPRNGETTLAASGGQEGAALGGEAVAPDAAGSGIVADSPEQAPGAAVSGGADSVQPSSGGATRAAAGGARSAARTDRTSEAGPAGNVTGVTKDSITVSIIAGFSGPLAAMVNRAYDGFLTWQEDVNAAGGYHGRKVVLKKVDHKETADGGVAACKQTLSNGSLLAYVPEGVEANLTAVSCLDAAGVPTLYYSPIADRKWKSAFSAALTSADAGPQMASYVSNSLKGKGKKVGVIYVNQAAYKATSDTFVPEARRLGVDVAAVEAVEPNQASFTAQLLRMKNAGVKILLISATAEAVGILRDARSIDFKPQITGWGFAFDFLTVAGRNLFEGVTGLRPYATTDTPAYKRYAARMDARGRGRSRPDDLEGFTAYGYALILGKVLEQAGPNPSRASVVAGAEGVRNFDSGVMAPFSWAPNDHVGVHATFPIVCCNSDWTWKGAGPPRTRY